MESFFCPQDCKFLNISEKTQNNQGTRSIRHKCLKYDKVLYHLLAQPLLYKCEECFKEN